MRIVLCGYMGSGKSLIGKKLARKLHVDFVDLDQKIEEWTKKSIPDIFKEKGEIAFRRLEAEVLEACLLDNSDDVLSLGGGTPCYGVNLDRIKAQPETQMFYLKVSLEELTRRLFKERNARPLIRDIESVEKLEDYIRKHLFERQHFYYQSDVVVDTSALSVEEIVDQIIVEMKKAAE